MRDERTEQLRERLAAVEARIGRACAAAGRPREDVRMVVVTKTHPADDVRRLAGLGVGDVGEAREQEGEPKARELAGLGLRWHFLGRLQSNKARAVAGWSDVVHSLDREKLVAPLSRGAVAAGRSVGCFVQVSLDGDPTRGGAAAGEVPGVCAAVAAAEGLHLLGVMAVAPLGEEPRAAFARLAGVAAEVRADHPGARWVSAGMSADLEAAVACGATHLRVGAAVLGPRPAPR